MMLKKDNLQDDLSSDDVIALLKEYSSHPSSNLALNKDTRCFTVTGIKGFIAYRFSGRRYIISVAGINTVSSDKDKILREFMLWADKIGRIIVSVQLNLEDADIYRCHGFKVNQIGASFSLPIENFCLSGSFFMKLRNKISRAKRQGVKVLEYGKDIMYSEKLNENLKSIDESWIKGKHAKKLEFLVGELGDIKNVDFSTKRLFIAYENDEPVAYILYVRSYGFFSGWMHELTRKKENTTSGVMELINITAIEKFSSERFHYLNFGFTPLAELHIENELVEAYSPLIRWLFSMLSKHGRSIYPSQSQLQYKLKWAPKFITPEYIAFGKSSCLGGLWSFLRLVKAV